MKKRSIKILTAVVLVLALVFSMNAVAFAGVDSNNSSVLRTVVNIAKSFVADSSKSATATVRATSSGETPYITSKMTLQSAALGSSSYSNVSGVSSSSRTVYDTTIILHSCDFPITSSKDYRVKIQLTDKVNGVESTVTSYCYLSR
ncbi:MAG: hypothetical protein AB9836_12110 [Aminipila sp.]